MDEVKIPNPMTSKDLVKLILVLLFPILAFADPASTLAGKNATLREEIGRSSATTSTSGTNTTFRDAQGRITGIAPQSNTFRDAQGRTTGTSSTTGTTTTYRDAQGRMTGTASTSPPN